MKNNLIKSWFLRRVGHWFMVWKVKWRAGEGNLVINSLTFSTFTTSLLKPTQIEGIFFQTPPPPKKKKKKSKRETPLRPFSVWYMWQVQQLISLVTISKTKEIVRVLLEALCWCIEYLKLWQRSFRPFGTFGMDQMDSGILQTDGWTAKNMHKKKKKILF